MTTQAVRALLLLQILAMPSVAVAQTFGYFGENGPSHWGTLSPDWVACGTGTIQSPIDFGKVAPHHGSLTTPPCTEGVKWVVMTETVTVSDEDMAQFAERIHFNARPVQREARPSHGRVP